ncbi:hypothetical protein HETIRDRAFT_414588 [Heterobasidion irregulare TC 32-1]|uniref:Uncharacterized protein n=1 Tax=Heterobasidion irregulare (strain TC 32-1) TaxID=747525 RepID=W4KJS7_HETIT|nr:uncharacterized protein HETIRDRAFT_414588 [Heterobasidion irregulare TC 32-1]ETW85580.1 hypothetical protein HETIRDRAFT_414588 [Heterobasidion irregulare TC 32-1]
MVVKGPNPALFAGVALLSFGAFYFLVNHRAVTAPASARPRPNDHPLVPPIHSEEADKPNPRTI